MFCNRNAAIKHKTKGQHRSVQHNKTKHVMWAPSTNCFPLRSVAITPYKLLMQNLLVFSKQGVRTFQLKAHIDPSESDQQICSHSRFSTTKQNSMEDKQENCSCQIRQDQNPVFSSVNDQVSTCYESLFPGFQQREAGFSEVLPFPSLVLTNATLDVPLQVLLMFLRSLYSS